MKTFKLVLILLALVMAGCAQLEIAKDCKQVVDMDGIFVCKKI